MYEIIREDEGRAIGIRTDSPLSAADARTLGAYLDDAINDHGSIRLLIERTDSAPGAGASLPVAQHDAVARVAVVGAPEAGLADGFGAAEVEYFDAGHLTEAWSWVRGKL